MMGRDGQDPLFLQAKEAEASVLEPYVGESEFGNHGERVVEGQWLMQAASDILLGWLPATGWTQERDFYVRQLWDGKRSVEVETLPPKAWDLRAGLRLDARPGPRALGRPDRDRRLHGQGRDLRQRDRRFLGALRRPERARLRRARRRGQVGAGSRWKTTSTKVAGRGQNRTWPGAVQVWPFRRQKTAIGLRGDPVPPTTRSDAPTNRNSHRPPARRRLKRSSNCR